ARTAMLRGDLDATRAAVEVLESDPRHDRGVISANPWHVTAVELYLACGELHEADRLLERISSDLADRDDPVLTVALGRLRAIRLAHSGKDDAATEAFEQALGDAEGCPAPLEVALLQLELGVSNRAQLVAAMGEDPAPV